MAGGRYEYKTSQEKLTEAVIRAATYEGHASAMVISLCMTGNPERAKIWEAEEAIWRQRGDQLIGNARVGQLQLRMDSLKAHGAASRGVDPIDMMRSLDMTATVEQK